MQNPSLSDIKKRTQRYWFEDGIWELGFGLANLLLGLFFYLVVTFQLKGILLAAGQVAMVIGVFFGLGFFVKALKERITYPRTGYVVYHRPSTSARLKRILLTAGLSAGIGALVGIGATVKLVRNTPALLSGILIGASLVYLGRRFQINRLYVEAALTLLLGYTISLMEISGVTVTAIFFSAFGLLMAVSGGAALLIYLIRSRNASVNDWEEEDQGHRSES